MLVVIWRFGLAFQPSTTGSFKLSALVYNGAGIEFGSGLGTNSALMHSRLSKLGRVEPSPRLAKI